MKFEKLDVHRHDLYKVAELMYETDIETYNFYFKNQKNAAERIKKLIKAGNNSLGHEKIYVVTGGENQIFGALAACRGDEDDLISDFKAYFKKLSFIDALKFVFLDIVGIWFGANLDKDDFYLLDVSVHEKCRGKGIGSFILENSLILARVKGCKRVVLDVDLENEGALRLYKRIGFKICNKKSIRWFKKDKGVYVMEYKLI